MPVTVNITEKLFSYYLVTLGFVQYGLKRGNSGDNASVVTKIIVSIL